MKTKLLFISWFLLIANSLLSVEPQIYITYKNGTTDTLTFSEENVFNVVMDSLPISVSYDKTKKDFSITNDFSNEILIFPNPAESSVNIYYTSEISTYAEISISNLQGNIIKEISKFILVKGFIDLSWDCTDNNGNKVSPGTYFFELKFPNKILTKKIVILR